MVKPLMWLRVATLVALPALGTWGVMIHQGPASGAGLLLRMLIAFLLTVAPAVMFLGFGLGIFSFPTQPIRALATVFLTPALLVVTTVLLGWGPWLFFVDEAFAEMAGMGLGAGVAAMIHGAGSGALRGCGAVVFVGAGVAAGTFFGMPMFATRRIDAVWVVLNLVALAWSAYVFFAIFAYYGLRKRQADGTLSADGHNKLAAFAGRDGEASTLSLSGGVQKAAIVVGLTAWLLSIPAAALFAGAVTSDGASSGDRTDEASPAKPDGPRRKGARKGRRPRRR